MTNNHKFLGINNKTNIISLLVIAAVTITLVGVLFDFKNTITYIGSDLRNRVVAARLVLEGIDPYFFKWTPDLSDRLYDPLEIPDAILSKVSVPPTVLALHSIIAKFGYSQQKIIWLIVQWVAFISTILIFLKASDSQARNNLILAIGFFLPTVYSGVFM